MLLNFSTLRGTGSAKVGLGFLKGLANLGAASGHKVYIPADWTLPDDGSLSGLRLLKVSTGLSAKFLFENLWLRKSLRHVPDAVLLSGGDTSIIGSPVPHVLFVQQAHLAYHAKDWGYKPDWRTLLKMKAMAAYFASQYRYVDKFTVQTQDMRQALCQRWSIDPQKVIVIPSAVEVSQNNKPAWQCAKKHDLTYVASASPHKNHIIIADILDALSTKHPNIHCALTISPEALPALNKRARKLGVLDNIQFLGSVPHEKALALARESRVVLMPSKLESFGLPYYEAMAQGAAIVAADKGFAREACADAALYADADDAEGFASHIEKLLNSPKLRQEMGEKALAQYDPQKITWPQVAQRYLDLMQSLR